MFVVAGEAAEEAAEEEVVDGLFDVEVLGALEVVGEVDEGVDEGVGDVEGAEGEVVGSAAAPGRVVLGTIATPMSAPAAAAAAAIAVPTVGTERVTRGRGCARSGCIWIPSFRELHQANHLRR